MGFIGYTGHLCVPYINLKPLCSETLPARYHQACKIGIPSGTPAALLWHQYQLEA